MVNKVTYRCEGQCAKVLHLCEYVRVEVGRGSLLLHQLPEVIEGELIAVFLTAVFGTVHLHSIVRQVDEVVVEVLRRH